MLIDWHQISWKLEGFPVKLWSSVLDTEMWRALLTSQRALANDGLKLLYVPSDAAVWWTILTYSLLPICGASKDLWSQWTCCLVSSALTTLLTPAFNCLFFSFFILSLRTSMNPEITAGLVQEVKKQPQQCWIPPEITNMEHYYTLSLIL